ncbi:hypothetical protein M2106_000525 [Paenibacillus sp. PastF-2]|nr:hypothetical protein [Paenibacillus sp. PastF-2]MDF9846111.1 hypothetical protein [Paenibacillus sp. PastM-2]
MVTKDAFHPEIFFFRDFSSCKPLIQNPLRVIIVIPGIPVSLSPNQQGVRTAIEDELEAADGYDFRSNSRF